MTELRGERKRERERFEDVILLALEMKEGDTNQGMGRL